MSTGVNDILLLLLLLFCHCIYVTGMAAASEHRVPDGADVWQGCAGAGMCLSHQHVLNRQVSLTMLVHACLTALHRRFGSPGRLHVPPRFYAGSCLQIKESNRWWSVLLCVVHKPSLLLTL